jgi:hypothetical protein
MDPKRRRMFQIAALSLALFILAFVVIRGGAPESPAALEQPGASGDTPPHATSPAAGTSAGNRFGIIGPATKADPHAVRRAVKSLSELAPNGAPPQAAPASPPEKP